MNFVVFGPGGAGKGTIIRELVRRDERLWLSRSWTTRSARPGESPEAYTFVDRSSFEDRARVGGFLEWAEVLGELYGTPLPDPPPGADVVLEIDVAGARQVLERCSDVACVLVVAPSEAEQRARLLGRGDSETRTRERLQLGRREVEEGRPIASLVIVNDDLERAVSELAAFIEEARKVRAG